MTRSAEESSFVALINQLSQAIEPEAIFTALRAITHRLIGHDQNKELFVKLGIAEPLAVILGNHDMGLNDARVEAAAAVGSLAYGGESYVVHLVSKGILPRLTSLLDPTTSPDRLTLYSLRTLVTMLDTYISPENYVSTRAAITSAIYKPEILRCLRTILSRSSSSTIEQQQIALTASLIAKSFSRSSQLATSDDVYKTTQNSQKLSVQAGVLDALATRLGSFCVSDHAKGKNGAAIPPPAPSNASIAPILDAIAAIIQGSGLRAIEFLFSPTLLAIFPPGSGLDKSERTPSGSTSTFLPWTGSSSNLIKAPQNIITPAAFPPLSAATASGAFPPLSSSAFPALHHHNSVGLTEPHQVLLGNIATNDDSESSGGDTPMRRRGETADPEDDDRSRNVHPGIKYANSHNLGPEVEVEETGIINWLISQVRTGDPLRILGASNVIANLFYVGLIHKKLSNFLGLIVVPVLVRLLKDTDEEQRKVISFGSNSVGGVDAQTWKKWQIEENAPAVLSKLVMESVDLQKAAVGAGAIKRLATMLKASCESPASTANGVNGDSSHILPEEPLNKTNPIYNHRMRVKESTLLCLANIGLSCDEFRESIIEAGVISTIVQSCLKSLAPIHPTVPTEEMNSEGSPPMVLIAACNVVRSLSRSVSILRTSLIDAGIAVPLLTLLRHDDLDVRIAASASVCNLVLEFSPMRRPMMDAGAIKVLCDLCRSDNHPLRLNALWALKHLVLDADPTTKEKVFEGLGPEFLMQIISVMPNDEVLDEDMHDPESPMEVSIDSGQEKSAWAHSHLPPKAAAAVRLLQKQEQISPSALAKQQAISLQEQGIEFFRNLLCGTEVANMIELVFSHIESDRLLSLMETLLNAPNQAGEIVNAIVYTLVHLAAGAPAHRQKIIDREVLMRCLLDLWNHRMVDVRRGLAWVLINLTCADEGDEPEGVRQRVNALRELGWPERLKEMRKDNELDVKERVKTAEYQMGIGLATTSSGRDARS